MTGSLPGNGETDGTAETVVAGGRATVGAAGERPVCAAVGNGATEGDGADGTATCGRLAMAEGPVACGRLAVAEGPVTCGRLAVGWAAGFDGTDPFPWVGATLGGFDGFIPDVDVGGDGVGDKVLPLCNPRCCGSCCSHQNSSFTVSSARWGHRLPFCFFQQSPSQSTFAAATAPLVINNSSASSRG